MRFRAFQNQQSPYPLIAVDLGYSEKSKSCGVGWDGRFEEKRFGETIEFVATTVHSCLDPHLVLVLEAPLSRRHNEFGNPVPRGDFEAGRRWYVQPAATVCLAALRFLEMLAQRVGERDLLLVAEAFLSNKAERKGHAEDARLIHDQFWKTPVEELFPDTEPLSSLIEGTPSVRVFK